MAKPHAITRVQTMKPPKEAFELSGDEKCAVGQNMIAPSE